MNKDVVIYLGHRAGVSKKGNDYCMLFICFEDRGVTGYATDTVFLNDPAYDLSKVAPMDKLELDCDRRGNVYGVKVVGKVV